ncbi:MAG TPA: DUF262 domain-containing protein [Verrucomicrobiae bacterium]|jgi:hypothetical protein|nr:DUF262 domain-containing protein [Verrucomicrobiae bacterium]
MRLRDRRSTIQAIGWVRDMYSAKLLNLDPPYQRRSVWNEDYKQFFIDSIFRNYPVPPVFVNLEVTGDGTTLYHVIDGKQRLLSIIEFLADRFPYSRKQYGLPHLAGKYFSELDPSDQKGFYSYFLPFEFFTEISDEMVVEIFDRFNRNVKQLNDQELRHAKYAGAFIGLMEHLADEPFWQDFKFFTRADIRRMKDVEYVSQIFLLTMFGILEEDALDSYYAQYDEAVPEADVHLGKYAEIQGAIRNLTQLVRETRFKNKADFYSLWSALGDVAPLSSIDFKSTIDSLTLLATNVTEVGSAEDPSAFPEDAVIYSQAVRAGTSKKQNREKRRDIIKTYIALK